MAQYLIPIFGVTLSVIILGERIETYHMAGMAAIFTGVWLVTSGQKKKGVGVKDETTEARNDD
jgi:drug/metabolite transporter (DMT)-like permease